MRLHRIETNLIEQSTDGQKFADEYEAKLKEQNAFKERRDSTENIQLVAEYFFDVDVEE